MYHIHTCTTLYVRQSDTVFLSIRNLYMYMYRRINKSMCMYMYIHMYIIKIEYYFKILLISKILTNVYHSVCAYGHCIPVYLIDDMLLVIMSRACMAL